MFDPAVLQTFRDELRKEAFDFGGLVQRGKPLLKNVGSLAGVGAMGGAALGAARSGAHAYQDAREQGEGVGGSLLSAVPGALGGAARGAGTGALVGAAAGAGAHALGRDVSGLTGSAGPLGAAARFGQRQVHSVTGMLSPQELEGVRGGVYGAKRQAQQAFGTLQAAEKGSDMGAIRSAQRASEKANRGLEASAAVTGHETARDPAMDLTSIPGYIRAARDPKAGLGRALHAGAREQLTNAHPAAAALMVGAPVLGTAAALHGPDVDERGRGRLERVGEGLGGAVGGFAGGAMPIVGSSLVGSAGSGAGRLVGRGLDRLRGVGPGKAPPPDQAEGQHIPTERVTSPAAAGQQNDVGI